MNKNSVMENLIQVKRCCFWCIEAEYHVHLMLNYTVTDDIVIRRSTKLKIVHLQANPDSMKPAYYEIIS